MIPQRLLQLSLAWLTLTCYSGIAAAQPGYQGYPNQPGSGSGELSNQLLREIYRRDIGRGFTGSSQNSITLNRSTARVPFVGQTTTQWGAPRLGLGFSQTVLGKPFSSYRPPATMSPYMNLFREDLSGSGDMNYQMLVRPMLEQQEINRQMQRENQLLSRRVQSLATQSALSATEGTGLIPTGHQTTFGYYSHFYPAASTPAGSR